MLNYLDASRAEFEFISSVHDVLRAHNRDMDGGRVVRRQQISVGLLRWAQAILSPIPQSQLSVLHKGSLDFALLTDWPTPRNVIPSSKSKKKIKWRIVKVSGRYLIRVTL